MTQNNKNQNRQDASSKKQDDSVEAGLAETLDGASEDSAKPEEGSQSEATPEELIVQLEADVEKLKQDRLLALADAENANKRADKRITDNARHANAGICKALLQVADNLGRALAAAPDDVRNSSDAVMNLAVGVEMTERELLGVLESQGVKRLESLGQLFDPNHHQAIQQIEDKELPEGTVVEVVQEGYIMNGRLLREAMVIVSKGGTKREEATDTENGGADANISLSNSD